MARRRKPTQEQTRSRLRTRNGRWYLDVRDLGGGREALIPEGQSYATTDLDVALKLAGERIKQLEDGERGRQLSGRTRTETVGRFAREWLAYKRALAKGGQGFTSARTLKRYEQGLTQLFGVLDQDTPMHAARRRDVKLALARLRSEPRAETGRPLSASSLRQIIAAMQLIYDHASDEGVVPEDYNPWRSLRAADRPRLPAASSTDFLETYEAHALLEGCKRVATRYVPLRAIVATFLLTGGRNEEVLGLEVGDVDFRRKTLRFHSNDWRGIKTHNERTVPLWPQLEAILRAYLAERPRISGLLFPGYDPKTFEEQMITKLHKPINAAKKLAVAALRREHGEAVGAALARKAVNARAFRPTYCAARLQTLDGGRAVAAFTVREEMGHNSLAMINRVYGRLGLVRHRSDVVEYVALSTSQEAALRDAVGGGTGGT